MENNYSETLVHALQVIENIQLVLE